MVRAAGLLFRRDETHSGLRQRPDLLVDTWKGPAGCCVETGMEVMKAEAGVVVVRILQAAGGGILEKKSKK